MKKYLVFKSAEELASLIREKKVSSVKVVQAHLKQIKKHNSRIAAVVTLCEKDALREARIADKRIQNGLPLGPLHGVPITIKDSYRVKGIRSTFGALPQYRNSIPTQNCELVKKLRDAGAIILGRTNVPLLSFDWQCRNPLFKEGLNPWDTSRTPGGSSGGAAAAVASGFTPLELGSDLGGSTRYPAHCCGILGFRPSEGLLPIHDLGPEGMPQAFHHLLSCGPMARNLSDLRLMLEILTGGVSYRIKNLESFEEPKVGLHASSAIQNQSSGRSKDNPLKICLTRSFLGIEPDLETQHALDNLKNTLTLQGHEVTESSPKNIDFEKAYETHGTMAGHELKSVLPGFFKTWVGHHLFTGYLFYLKLGKGPFTQWMKKGLTCSKSDYEMALNEKEKMSREMDSFFENYDLWMMPVSPSKAIPRQRWGFPIFHQGKSIPYSKFLGANLVPTAVFGTPVLTFPIQSRSKMPIGIQAHSKRGADFHLLDIVQENLSGLITVRIPPGFEE